MLTSRYLRDFVPPFASCACVQEGGGDFRWFGGGGSSLHGGLCAEGGGEAIKHSVVYPNCNLWGIVNKEQSAKVYSYM
jgi:hypothetical protein